MYRRTRDTNAFCLQRRAHFGCDLDMTHQQIVYPVGAEMRDTSIGKENLAVTGWQFAELSFQHGDRRFDVRYRTFLAPLPDHANVSTWAELDSFVRQSGHALLGGVATFELRTSLRELSLRRRSRSAKLSGPADVQNGYSSEKPVLPNMSRGRGPGNLSRPQRQVLDGVY